jgi:DNA-directed RNA polymerase specialized sigma24 family protein
MAGSDTEFAEYFSARAAGLRRLAYTLCGDWHTADDLVQTTFIKLYRHWHRIRGQSVDPYTRTHPGELLPLPSAGPQP